MATPNNPNLFVDESSAAPTPSVISVQTNTNDTKTLVVNYNDPALYATPMVQIRNDVGGSKGQIQFHNGTTFGGNSNLTYDESISKLSLRGNMYIYGNLVANINTNLNNLKITGGLGNQILATDGTGNLSWVSYDPNISGGIFNGNSNVIVYPNSDIRFSSNNVPNVVIVDSSGITSANLTVTGNTNLGANGNVTLDGGLPGQFLKTDGYGNLSWDQPAGIYMSDTAPFVGEGNVWFNTEEGRSYVSYDGTWVDMSPVILPNPDLYANTITFPDGTVFTTANVSGGGNSSFIANGISNVSIPSLNGAVSIKAASNTWTFNANGSIAAPYGILGATPLEEFGISAEAGTAAVIKSNDGVHKWTFGVDGNTTFPDGTTLGVVTGSGFALNTNKDITILKDAVTGFEVRGDNVKIYSNNIAWNFDGSNGITFPDATVQSTAFTGSATSATTAGTVTTNAQSNITSVGTLSSLSVTGNVKTNANVLATGNISTAANVTGNYILGNGSQLTGITATVAQTVSASSQSNITSVGTLTNLTVAGNIQAQGTTDSGGPTSGALKTSGGLGVAKTATIGHHLFVGNGASLTAFTNPTIIAKEVGADFIQAALVNASDTGSSDWTAYADNGTDGGGWADMGMTGSAFNDPTYTVTGPNDGYFFVQAQSASGLGGNLVIATGDQGTTNDIIFATGGFQTGNIFGRINHATQTLDIPAGSANIGGNIDIGGGANIDGNLSVTGNIRVGQLSATATDSYDAIQFSDNGTTDNGSIRVDAGSNMVVKVPSNFYVKRGGSDRVAVTDTTSDFMATTNVTIQSNKGGTTNTWSFYANGVLSAPGNISAAGQIVSTATGNSSDGGGQFYLNGSSNNRIDWNTNGTGAPAFTTRSAGAKLVLYPSLGGTAADYALGVDSGTLWSGVPQHDSGQFFKWYGGTTEVASLSGTGIMSVSGNITSGNLKTAGNVVFTANSGQVVFNTTAFITGNANSIGRDGSILLQPYTGAGSSFPGVVIGGAGRLIAPNGSVHQIFNTSDVTFQVAVKAVATAATSTTTGGLQAGGGIGVVGNTYIGGSIVRTGAVTQTAWATTGVGLKMPAAIYTDTSTAAGTQAGSYINVMDTPSLAFSNAVTVTNAATLYVAAPNAGTNATITNPYAIMARGDVSIFGNVTANGTAGISIPNLPAFRVYGSAGTIIVGSNTINNSTTTTTIDYNTGSHYDNTTGIFTAPVAGVYHVFGTVRVADYNGLNQAAIIKNGSTPSGANVIAFWEISGNSATAHMPLTGDCKLAVGDTLRLQTVLGNIQFDSNDSWGVTFVG